MKLLLTMSALVVTLNANITLPKNFQTDFQQTITNDKGKVINYDGKVAFNNIDQYGQNLFKWNYTSPTQKEVCTNGANLIVIDHDLEQVSTYQVEEGINLEAILNVAKKITNETYQATYKDTEYIITLDKSNQLKKIVYVDNLDNAVKIIFNNMDYNISSFDMKLLECNAPSEYDIIEG